MTQSGCYFTWGDYITNLVKVGIVLMLRGGANLIRGTLELLMKNMRGDKFG